MNTIITLAAAAASAAGQPNLNPYAQPANAFEQRLYAAAFGEPGGDRALEDFLVGNPQLPPGDRIDGFAQLCRDYGFLGWGRLRIAACAEQTRLKKARGDADRGDDDQGMATAFADQPPPRAIGSAKVPLKWNAFGTQSATVRVNGVDSDWFVDTGAEISVVTESLAARMRVRPVGRPIRVGTTTSDVTGKVGIIDRLQIGSAYAENVPVLILKDAQLKLGNVHQIDGILGIQPMVAFGRIAWVEGGRSLALGDAAPAARPTAPHIYWHDEGVGIPLQTDRGLMGAFLDTGANGTYWRDAGLPLLDPQLVANAKETTAHVGGAGGVIERKQRELRSVDFRLGQVPIRLSKVAIAPPGHVGAAWVGMDAVSQFGTLILDFEHMRIDGRLKTAAERKATHLTLLTEKDVKIDEEKPASPK